MRYTTGDTPIPPTYHRFLGSKTGIVRELTITPPGRTAPQGYTSAATVTDLGTQWGSDSTDSELRTGGKGVDPTGVLTGAIGETCERYARLWPDPTAITTATYNTMATDERVVPFEYVDVFDRENGPELPPLTRETELAWVEGVDLLADESVFVPAALAWDRVEELTGIPQQFPTTSSGCAAGATATDALLGGLLELIERDGVMRTWLTQETPPSVRPDRPTLDELVPDVNLECHLFEFDSRTPIPTIGVALVDSADRRPKFVVGGAAGFDVESVVLDAFSEAVQSYQYLRHQYAFEEPAEVGIDDVIANFRDNCLLYADPDHFEHVSVLLDGSPTPIDVDPSVRPAGDSTGGKLDAVLGALEEADCTPIAIDITPRDIDEVGVHVVQLYVPELLPLTPPSFLPVDHPDVADRDPTSLPHPYP